MDYTDESFCKIGDHYHHGKPCGPDAGSNLTRSTESSSSRSLCRLLQHSYNKPSLLARTTNRSCQLLSHRIVRSVQRLIPTLPCCSMIGHASRNLPPRFEKTQRIHKVKISHMLSICRWLPENLGSGLLQRASSRDLISRRIRDIGAIFNSYRDPWLSAHQFGAQLDFFSTKG